MKEPPETQPQPTSRERLSTPLGLEELARLLGFEDWHEELKLLENEILNEHLHDAKEIERLLSFYEAVASKIMEEKGKRSDIDSLALILQKAHLRYIKGLYEAVLEVSFANINELFNSLEINDETYELVGNTMTDTRQKIADYRDTFGDPVLE